MFTGIPYSLSQKTPVSVSRTTTKNNHKQGDLNNRRLSSHDMILGGIIILGEIII